MNDINEELITAQRKEIQSVLTMIENCTAPDGLTRSEICKNEQSTKDTVLMAMLLAHQEVFPKDSIQSLSKQCYHQYPALETLGEAFTQFNPQAPSLVTHLLKQMASIAMQRFSHAYINGVLLNLPFCDMALERLPWTHTFSMA